MQQRLQQLLILKSNILKSQQRHAVLPQVLKRPLLKAPWQVEHLYYPCGACDDGEMCPHVVQVALATDCVGALQADEGVDGAAIAIYA